MPKTKRIPGTETDDEFGLRELSTSVREKLTEKQEQFCIAYMLNGNNALAAYREAYDCENSNETTIRKESHRIMQNKKILAAIDEFQSDTGRRKELTIESQYNRLLSIINDESSSGGLKLKAIDILNKMRGFYAPEEIQHNLGASPGSDGSIKIEFVTPQQNIIDVKAEEVVEVNEALEVKDVN